MTPDQRLSSLMAVAEFSPIAAPALAALAAAMREEFFSAGETLVFIGEPADRLFVLCEGELSVEAPGGARRGLHKGALLGELGFLIDSQRTATVRASRDSVLLSLPYLNFRNFLLANPESALILAERLARQIYALEHRSAG
jgi:CRP-like cAMP-binding protein